VKVLTSFEQIKQHMARFYEYSRAGNYTLDNMQALMDHLGQPQEKFKTIHIAGTSGKTSTAYYMAALLAASEKKVGLTVSPHVLEINERVQVNGTPLAEKDFCEAFTEFLGLVETFDLKPSWFEVMVAFAYWYFAQAGVDYAVVEVGLGGLKDGTNIIKRLDKVCVITDLGLDHVDVLGSNLAEIAGQKIGIAQQHNQIFTYPKSPEIMTVFKKQADAIDAKLHIVPEDAHTKRADYIQSMPDFQKRNWFLAYEVYRHLQIQDDLPALSSAGLRQTQALVVPGRMDVIKLQGKTVVMDGAHNAQKMTAFAKSFKHLYPGVRPAVLIALKEGKEDQLVAPLIGPLASRLVVTTFKVTQDLPFESMDPYHLAEAFKSYVEDIKIIPSQAEAVRELLGGQEQTIIITGSFYLISQLTSQGLLN
jgi:dihydrofolate synthase / folylpolyglutamate synthase